MLYNRKMKGIDRKTGGQVDSKSLDRWAEVAPSPAQGVF